jgi:hypothetical protein
MKEMDIIHLVERDEWMMSVLRTARTLNLPDWMIGAGFIRNKIWDHLHGYTERTPLADIDFIYFDLTNLAEEQEKIYDARLREILNTQWSTKNQARMSVLNKEEPYCSSEDALAHWIETSTCTAIKLLTDDTLQLIAPHGIEDLVNLKIKPSPSNRARSLYAERIAKKNWSSIWPKLEILGL